MSNTEALEMQMRLIYGPHYKDIGVSYNAVNDMLANCHKAGHRLVFDLEIKGRREGADYRQINIAVIDLQNSREPLFATGWMDENKAILKATHFTMKLINARNRDCFIPGTGFRRWTPPMPAGALLN